MRTRPFPAICAALLVAAVPLAAPPAAAAGDHPRHRADLLSGASPFAAGCAGRQGEDTAITGAEVEPTITGDPADPRHLVATWQQDIGGLAARSDVVASSTDAGRTWTHSVVPGLTVCTGGTADFASDPWLSIGGDGTVYLSAATGSPSADPPPVAMVASTSADGGRTWREPTTVSPAEPGNDTDSIAASPTRDGHAYLVWGTWDHSYSPPMSNALRFSRTTDSGDSWSSAVTVHTPEPTAIDFSGHVLELPDGDLLAVWVNADVVAGQGSVLASRSADEGATWQPAVLIATQPVGSFADPESGVELPQPGFASPVLGSDGTVYLATEASRSPTEGAVVVHSSEDGGGTWSSHPLPGVTAFAFQPAMAVDASGALGIVWYDLRSDVPGDAVLSTDVWFARSTDRGASWHEQHVAGPFDLRTAPNHRLGEYQGLAGLRRGFVAVVTVTTPVAQDGPSDVLVARLATGRHHR